MRICISPNVYILAAIAILLLPIPWIGAWFFAAIVHEFGHYLALRIFGRKLEKVEVGANGAQMVSSALKPVEAMACYLAGPALASGLLFLYRFFPRVAFCALIQSCYNLLPINPLDGGKFLSVLMTTLLGDATGKWVFLFVETTVLILLTVIAFYLSFVLRLGLLPLFLTALFVSKHKKIKIPCKACRHAVQ